jgi:hypothetical protein
VPGRVSTGHEGIRYRFALRRRALMTAVALAALTGKGCAGAPGPHTPAPTAVRPTAPSGRTPENTAGVDPSRDRRPAPRDYRTRSV